MNDILVSCVHLQRRFGLFAEEFAERGLRVALPEVTQQLSESWLLDNVARFRGVIAGDDPFTAEVIEKGSNGELEALVKWGIGTDAIDIDACRRNGVAFANTPDVFGNEVADVACGYIIMLARQLHRVHESVLAGGWEKPIGMSLSGKSLGIIGLGSIGRAIAIRGDSFGMRVLGADIVSPDFDLPSVEMCTFDEVLRRADVLVLACNLTKDNHHLIDEETIGRMKEGAFLVNVARGPLVREEDLVQALRDGGLAGAALDVFEEEPLPTDSELRQIESCILGSHNGSNTVEAVARVNRMAVDRLFELLGV